MSLVRNMTVNLAQEQAESEGDISCIVSSMASSVASNDSSSSTWTKGSDDRFSVDGRLQVVLDMETGDPDDFLTLLFLLGHPSVHLKAVTVVPGTPDQIGFIRYALGRFGREDLPLGSFNMDGKPALSAFHLKIYPDAHIEACREALQGSDVLLAHCDANTILICGGPLKNVAKAIRTGPLKVGRLVAQGGFAGDNVVPAEKRLAKFEGRLTCPTFNLAGDIGAAETVLAYQGIEEKFFVSKNVCHGVIYTLDTHRRLEALKDRSQSLKEIYDLMTIYLKRKGHRGKALHDPLAACCAIDLSIGQWARVLLSMDAKTKEWGSTLSDHPNVNIIIGYDEEKFLATLFAFV